MFQSKFRRLLTVPGAIFLAVGVIGCGSKVSGKYVAAAGMMTVDFEGGQATVTSPVSPQPETDPYTVSGNTVTIKSKDGDMTLTIMQDGSLQGNGITLNKAAN
jgi:hypothetical protein